MHGSRSLTWIKLLVNYDKNRAEYCGAQSRHCTLRLFFRDFLPIHAGVAGARRDSRNSLSTPGNERVPFRLHFARAFSHSDSAANLSSGPLNIDLQSRTLGPNHLFIPISFLLSNPRNINARLDYDRAGRKFIHYYHIYSRSENSCNSIFKIKDESCVYIPIFEMQLFQKKIWLIFLRKYLI